MAAAVKAVAAELHNTPAVCRRSYVHPALPEAFVDGTFHHRWDAGPSRPARSLTVDERRLLDFLAPPA